MPEEQSNNLYERAEFVEKVLKRDHGKCVLCGTAQGITVHHILERKLWPDGGYYVDNGATLCEQHHLAAEYTMLSVDAIRTAAQIDRPVLPPQLFPGENYDKWGNLILPNRTRLRGEMFQEEQCQKALQAGGVLTLFSPYVKYPKTLHLPWSPNLQNEDRLIDSLAAFEHEDIVITAKMDGENSSLYHDHCHARSLDSKHHPSRSWLKSLHATIKADIPKGYRFCGENMFAKHSIFYDDLESYFLLFSVWDPSDACLDWDATVEWASLLNLALVPVLYRGPWSIDILHAIESQLRPDKDEGYVVRVARRFRFAEFSRVVAKYVRKGHVQTDEFWMNQPVSPNQLRAGTAAG